MDYSTNTLSELKTLLKDKQLRTTGKKADLIQRLQEYDKKAETERKRFKVFIKTLVGSCYTVYIERTATILELKQKIEEKTGMTPSNQILLTSSESSKGMGFLLYPIGAIGKKFTDDSQTLASLDVNNESTIHLQMKL
jgi:hypothetical protein